MQPKLRDCDFLKAPRGDKNCHFDKTVVAANHGERRTRITDVTSGGAKVQDRS